MSTSSDLHIGIIDLIRALDPVNRGPDLPAFVQKLKPKSFLRIELLQAGSDLQKLIRRISDQMSLEDEQEAMLARAQVELALERIRAGGGIIGIEQGKNLVVMDQDQESTYTFDLDLIRGQQN